MSMRLARFLAASLFVLCAVGLAFAINRHDWLNAVWAVTTALAILTVLFNRKTIGSLNLALALQHDLIDTMIMRELETLSNDEVRARLAERGYDLKEIDAFAERLKEKIAEWQTAHDGTAPPDFVCPDMPRPRPAQPDRQH